MNYIKSLDGVRALAIALVILFHLGLFLPGWVGVQLFFVLSGYLITSILLTERKQSLGDYLRRFYWRRSLRIFPLYFTFLAVASVVFAMTGLPSSFGADRIFLFTYTTNFGRLLEKDIGPTFVHFWSLAVEEQFYLIWPLLVWMAPRPLFKLLVILLIVLTPLARFLLYLLFAGHDDDWIGRNIYSITFSQFDAFAIGAAISLWKLYEWKRAALLAASLTALAATLGLSVLIYQHIAYRAAIKWSFGYSMYLMPGYGFVWGYSIINLLSASLIVLAMQRHWTCRPLEWGPVVHVGRISYGLYVLHMPVLRLVNEVPLANVTRELLFGIVLIASAHLSFRYLEKPFLKWKSLVQ
ncbi:acyltransferase [Bradyrhizobium sp. 157]|uniref:acyltransferase family protein n=1 Tax=Bradyrhizobium sp. 157 TaxID=2782631 RepID=UPI001FF9B26F|nr:acyltransferase [Bradyrhizobium sp. 157]MCK1642993.1 acyltransferase [Bradyrhizobium sp. 157]